MVVPVIDSESKDAPLDPANLSEPAAAPPLTAPVAALSGTANANQQIAQVVGKNGRIEQRQVQVGISDRLRVQVLDGLSEGDHLLIGPADGNGG